VLPALIVAACTPGATSATDAHMMKVIDACRIESVRIGPTDDHAKLVLTLDPRESEIESKKRCVFDHLRNQGVRADIRMGSIRTEPFT
jgi:hypothetical protein